MSSTPPPSYHTSPNSAHLPSPAPSPISARGPRNVSDQDILDILHGRAEWPPFRRDTVLDEIITAGNGTRTGPTQEVTTSHPPPGSTSLTACVPRASPSPLITPPSHPRSIGHTPRVGASGFLDYSPDDPLASTNKDVTVDLEAFLRGQDPGPYPSMDDLAQIPRPPSTVPDVQPRRNGPASSPRSDRSPTPTRAGNGENPYRVGNNRRLGGLRSRLHTLADNRLPTISSHHSQEGSITSRTVAVPVGAIPPTATGTPASGVAPVDRHDSTRSASSVGSRRTSYNVGSGRSNNTYRGDERIGVAFENQDQTSRPAPETNPVIIPSVSTQVPPSTALIPEGARATSRHLALLDQPESLPVTGSDQGTSPASRQRPVLRIDTSVPSELEMSSQRRYPHRGIKKGDRAEKCVYYDKNGDVKRVWKLEYSKKSEGHEGRKGEGSRYPIHESSSSQARNIPSISDQTAITLAIFQAQERIEALEVEREVKRHDLRMQRREMMTFPAELIEQASQVRREMKKVVEGIDEEIKGWKETVDCLKKVCG